MQRFIYLLVIILLPLFSFSQKWKTFTDTAGMFTASYPSGWVNKIKAGNRVFFTSPPDSETDDFYENLNISVTYNALYGAETRIRDLFPAVTNNIKTAFTGFEEESLRYFKWNDLDAAELIYSGYNKNNESLKLRNTQWFCFFKSRLYLATFVALADKNTHNETAGKIMKSIIFQ